LGIFHFFKFSGNPSFSTFTWWFTILQVWSCSITYIHIFIFCFVTYCMLLQVGVFDHGLMSSWQNSYFTTCTYGRQLQQTFEAHVHFCWLLTHNICRVISAVSVSLFCLSANTKSWTARPALTVFDVFNGTTYGVSVVWKSKFTTLLNITQMWEMWICNREYGKCTILQSTVCQSTKKKKSNYFLV